jgi:AraC-like DNA-binding protein
MFFHNLHVTNVRRTTAASVQGEDGNPRLLFVLGDQARLSITGETFCCSEHDLFLLAPENRLDCCAKDIPAVQVVLVEFAVTDSHFSEILSRMGPKLQVDELTVRSCLLKILNCYTLKPAFFEDSIDYNVISLLYYGYISSECQKSLLPFAPEGNPFSHTPNKNYKNVVNYINEHISDDISINELCEVARQSPKQIEEMFKSESGCTVLQFINRFRIFKAKEFMCYTDFTITEISYRTGFKSIHYFSRYFKEKENISPIEYKRALVRLTPPSGGQRKIG